MPRHNELLLLLLFLCSQNNEAKTCTEMAFRLHHYEALIRDKESLQMPLVGMFEGLLPLSPWANTTVPSRTSERENRKRKFKKLFFNCINIADRVD